eukprot:CAMPEP_0195523582 /NCGR_PEP_ID=MMETSP0794_2-20130614/22833_1 /TAXON_ID=515487 /ORGANISM="Stephanopyxis turris, Strain CCMP 815" /LENGTH=1434 /DNA_ID=CAMNT_0040653605 /DNA_START=89 /DNA_END=4393 /DNA_ORIENTATION=-
MAAAAAAAAAEAAARETAEIASQAEMMEREAALSAAVSAIAAEEHHPYGDMEEDGGGYVGGEGDPEQQKFQTQEEMEMRYQQMYEMQQMQQMQEQQQYMEERQRMEEQHEAAMAAAAVAQAQEEADMIMRSRPEEHFLTLSKNGTILGATETVTGFPPSALLMTSAYDMVHNHDLVGLRAITTYFWEKGHPEVDAYIRRRTITGDWVWLAAKVVSFIDLPVPGVIVHECIAKDTHMAKLISRTTRISALLATAIEAAHQSRKDGGSGGVADVPGDILEDSKGGGGGIMNMDSTDIASMLASGADEGAILEALGMNKQPGNDSNKAADTISNDNEDPSTDASHPSFSVMAMVRSGVCLDLSKIHFSVAELKMLGYVLSGRIPIEDLPRLVMIAMNSPNMDLVGAMDSYLSEQEQVLIQQLQQKQAQDKPKSHHSRHRKNRSSLEGVSSFLGSRRQRQSSSRIKSPLLKDTGKSSFDSKSSLGQLPVQLPPPNPPPLSILNMSYTNIGNTGMENISEILYLDSPLLKTLDIGFCGVGERGILALCRALQKRKKNDLPPLQGLILSGNVVTYKAAKELGAALSTASEQPRRRKRGLRNSAGTGYDEDDEWDEDDEDEYDDILFGHGKGKEKKETSHIIPSVEKKEKKEGLLLLHMACASMTPDSLHQLLLGLGQDCSIRELSIPSNNIGSQGATLLVSFLEGKGIAKYKKGQPVMPQLDRLDLSNNNLGNDGTAKLTRAISKRVNIKVNMVDLKLSCNEIGASGIETIMNKLLQHNLLSLSLDNNTIGDRGCQLVAASLPSMHSLVRLNLSFNQIGSRGIATLMRSLVGCESINYLGLSGNVMKISGAIAMGFTLSQHPRLAELELENCCLSQVAQCHIAAGIISNRWVPMKRMNGFRAAPPMVAIGALDVMCQAMDNEECFRIRRDMQMKNIFQWMESNRSGQGAEGTRHAQTTDENILTGDFVSQSNEVQGMPSQSAYLRMLDWLSRIPFDEDELADLRSYFYDIDSGDNERDSEGIINLRHRGDLLAALGSEIAEEALDDSIFQLPENCSALGLDLEANEKEHDESSSWKVWGSFVDLRRNEKAASAAKKGQENQLNSLLSTLDSHPAEDAANNDGNVLDTDQPALPKEVQKGEQASGKKRRKRSESTLSGELIRPSSTSIPININLDGAGDDGFDQHRSINKSSLSIARSSLSSMGGKQDSANSVRSNGSTGSRSRGNAKARISMFRPFAVKLEMLKAHAQELMDNEPDPMQQDIIAQQFAEASLTLLRQLRYHCMNSGLDGWRQGGNIRRKVLIVDDSMVTRKMVSRAFEKANFIVDTAADGEEGFAKLKGCIYDIAFMDIDMPVMNGFDATKKLRQWEDLYRPGARQPICALTAAYVDDFEREELMKFKDAGLDVMESKPCNIPRLFKVVDDVSPMFSDLSITVSNTVNQT